MMTTPLDRMYTAIQQYNNEATEYLNRDLPIAEAQSSSVPILAEPVPNENNSRFSMYMPSFFIDMSNRSWNWGNRTTTIHTNTEVPTKKSYQDNAALAIGACVLAIGAFALGYIQSLQQAQTKAIKNLNNLSQERTILANAEMLPELGEMQKFSLGILYDNMNLIYQKTASKTDQYAKAIICALIGGIFLVAGGLTPAPTLITIGYGLLAVSCAGAAYTTGAHWNDAALDIELYTDVKTRSQGLLNSWPVKA